MVADIQSKISHTEADMKAKVRGIKRRRRSFVRHITDQTQHFPQIYSESGYWHLPLPVEQRFIDSKNVPLGVKRFCIQTLLNRAQHLVATIPSSEAPRIVALISLPRLWNSQITVFSNANEMEAFFTRETDEQRWTPIENESLLNQWGLSLPSGFTEQGFSIEICDEGTTEHSQLWAVGQLYS